MEAVDFTVCNLITDSVPWKKNRLHNVSETSVSLTFTFLKLSDQGWSCHSCVIVVFCCKQLAGHSIPDTLVSVPSSKVYWVDFPVYWDLWCVLANFLNLCGCCIRAKKSIQYYKSSIIYLVPGWHFWAWQWSILNFFCQGILVISLSFITIINVSVTFHVWCNFTAIERSLTGEMYSWYIFCWEIKW